MTKGVGIIGPTGRKRSQTEGSTSESKPNASGAKPQEKIGTLRFWGNLFKSSPQLLNVEFKEEPLKDDCRRMFGAEKTGLEIKTYLKLEDNEQVNVCFEVYLGTKIEADGIAPALSLYDHSVQVGKGPVGLKHLASKANEYFKSNSFSSFKDAAKLAGKDLASELKGKTSSLFSSGGLLHDLFNE